MKLINNALNWMDRKLDKMVEMPVSDFEKKGDTILRIIVTTAFTLAGCAVLVAYAIQLIRG